MRSKYKASLVLLAGVSLGFFGMQDPVNAQQAPPAALKGQTVKTLASLELGAQIPEIKGRYLRARQFTLEPGGNGLLHNHLEIPVILHILSGTLTVCSPDGKCEEVQAGQTVAEGKDVTHWAQNRGTTTLTYLVVEIGKTP